MVQALYRKWRPQTWEDVVGQDHVVETLRNALAAEKGVHAYLFAGPRGTGKTTTARLLAKSVNCLEEDLAAHPCGQCEHCQMFAKGSFLDLIEIDAASNTSVEDVRDLRDKINFSPNYGRFKVYIIDEVHMLSTAAFNALLKTLEEPPAHAIFILATTEAHKIPATVTSRCQRHEFRRIPVQDIVGQLETIVQEEDIQAESEAIVLIARQSTGSMRDAISLLDQIASSGKTVDLELTHDLLGTAANQAVLNVIQALVDQRADEGLDHIHAALDAGSDPRQFARQVVDYLRNLLLVRMDSADQVESTYEVRELMARHVKAFEIADLLKVIEAFNYAANEGRSAWQPALPLEMAFVKSLQSSAGYDRPEVLTSDPVEKPAPEPTPEQKTVPRSTINQKAQATKAGGGVSEELKLSPSDQQDTQTLSEAWQHILGLVRKENPRAYGLLNSCKSRFMRGDQLWMYFASPVLKDQMEKPENISVAQQAISKVFKREISIQCGVDSSKRGAIPHGVVDDGMVAAAVRDLGGEIVDL